MDGVARRVEGQLYLTTYAMSRRNASGKTALPLFFPYVLAVVLALLPITSFALLPPFQRRFFFLCVLYLLLSTSKPGAVGDPVANDDSMRSKKWSLTQKKKK